MPTVAYYPTGEDHTMNDLRSFRYLKDALLAVFPEHEKYWNKRFQGCSGRQQAFIEEISKCLLDIAKADIGVERYCLDYKWLTNIVLEEEFHFRRYGKYRISSFAEAHREIYSNPDYMSRYMNGLLVSQLLWKNHTDVLQFLCDRFVPLLQHGTTHLEIGPGHGLLLYQIAKAAPCAAIHGWDISPTSIEQTGAALKAIGCDRSIELTQTDMFAARPAQFDSIVFSEVLEHLEDPENALDVVHRLLKPGGLLFLNAPVNSPAPDHIYLFRSPEEIVAMAEKAGFSKVDRLYAPSVGANLERARKNQLAISTVFIGRKTQGASESDTLPPSSSGNLARE